MQQNSAHFEEGIVRAVQEALDEGIEAETAASETGQAR